MFITSIEPPHHFLHHILNLRHKTSTVHRSNFTILRWNIGSTPIIFVTIVTPIEVSVVVVIPISNIMTLAVIVTIVPSLLSLILAPILLIGALGVWSETPRLLIYHIKVLLIVILISRWWWFRQVVHRIYLFFTPSDMLQH